MDCSLARFHGLPFFSSVYPHGPLRWLGCYGPVKQSFEVLHLVQSVTVLRVAGRRTSSNLLHKVTTQQLRRSRSCSRLHWRRSGHGQRPGKLASSSAHSPAAQVVDAVQSLAMVTFTAAMLTSGPASPTAKACPGSRRSTSSQRSGSGGQVVAMRTARSGC